MSKLEGHIHGCQIDSAKNISYVVKFEKYTVEINNKGYFTCISWWHGK